MGEKTLRMRKCDIMSCTLVTIQCMYNIRQSLFYFILFLSSRRYVEAFDQVTRGITCDGKDSG